MERQHFWIDFNARKGQDGHIYEQTALLCSPEEGNLVSSAVAKPILGIPDYWQHTFAQTKHAPALDLDVPARLIESSTPGHYHLYIDVECEWAAYVRLLDAMVACNILEPNYVEACKRQGATFLRPPGVTKGVNDSKPQPPDIMERLGIAARGDGIPF